MKTFSNLTSFVAINTPIRFTLDSKDLLAVNKCNVRGRGNQLPCAMTKQSCKFLTHSLKPLRILESLSDILKLAYWQKRMLGGNVDLFELVNTIYSSICHVVSPAREWRNKNNGLLTWRDKRRR